MQGKETYAGMSRTGKGDAVLRRQSHRPQQEAFVTVTAEFASWLMASWIEIDPQ